MMEEEWLGSDEDGNEKGKKILRSSYSVLQDDFLISCVLPDIPMWSVESVAAPRNI